MDKAVIVLLAICGFLLGATAYGSFAAGLGTGVLLAACFYFLIESGL